MLSPTSGEGGLNQIGGGGGGKDCPHFIFGGKRKEFVNLCSLIPYVRLNSAFMLQCFFRVISWHQKYINLYIGTKSTVVLKLYETHAHYFILK